MSTFSEGAVARAGDGRFAEKPPAPEADVELDDADELDDDLPCSECGGPNDDGEGWDGLCGSCADRAERDEDDDEDSRDEEDERRAEFAREDDEDR